MATKPDNALIFGELNPDGSIKRDVRICAISYKPIEGGDAMLVVPGTRTFYRVKAPFVWPQSAEKFAEQQAEIEANAPGVSAKTAQTVAPKSVVEPKAGE
jgi:hypothetical protein